jgi:hypothetical protein
MMMTGLSELMPDIARDRLGSLNPKLMVLCQRRFPDVNDKIFSI